MASKKELMEKMLELEEVNQELMEEIYETDLLMRQIGFSQGLATVKAVALDMYENGEINP